MKSFIFSRSRIGSSFKVNSLITTSPVFVFFVLVSACSQPKYIQQTQVVDRQQSDENQKTGFETCSFSTSLPDLKCSLQMSKSNLCVSVQAKVCPDLASKKYGTFFLKFYRQNLLDQSPVPMSVNEEVKVDLWMPSMGHGSAPVKVSNVDVGSYLLENVYFIMGGDWQIRIQIKKENENEKDEAIIPVYL